MKRPLRYMETMEGGLSVDKEPESKQFLRKGAVMKTIDDKGGFEL